MSTSTLSPVRPATSTADRIPALLPVVGADLPSPLVQGGTTPYACLDLAATAPALLAVAERVAEILPFYGSAHRGAGFASRVTTDLYEDARAAVGAFVGARSDDDVVITRNTTDALTLLSAALPAGSSVVVLDVEHHANLLPWRRHDLRCVRAESTVAQTLSALDDELGRRPTALLSVTGASNVTGEVLPLTDLVDLAHRHGARLCVDAAQLAPHRRIDLQSSGIDYVALSGHKLYAPYGAGALVGRHDWLDAASPYLPGGGAVREVGIEDVTWAPSPARHEGGSPNVLGAVALATACRTLAGLPDGAWQQHERSLLALLDDGLSSVRGVRQLRIWSDAPDRVGVASFTIDDIDPAFASTVLSAEHGIGVRDGRFCAHPLLARLTAQGAAVRASLGVCTTSTHVDRLVDALGRLVDDGPAWTYRRDASGWLPTPDARELDPLALGSHSGAASPCER